MAFTFKPGTRVEYRTDPSSPETHTFEVPDQASLDRNVAKYTADPDAYDVAVRLPGHNAEPA